MLSALVERELPRVCIVGAGLGGLMLGILLERIGIDYCILERATTLKPLGSAMSLTPGIQILFEQLGMLEDLVKISHVLPRVLQYDEKMNLTGELVHRDLKTLSGYENIVLTRPELYKLMLSKIPAERIVWSKRVLKVGESQDYKNKIHITCSDNSEYLADIVVGADGTYSAVRQNLFKVLEAEGKLPKEDKGQLKVGFTCMIGVTKPMDPEKYPELKDNFAHLKTIVGGWGAVNSDSSNTFCWQLNLQYLDKAEAERERFMNSEWGPEGNMSMIDEFRNRINPFGGTMGDFINATPPELISKVSLEHKMFKTWYHGRTVLIGDACHKMLPAAGQGAVNALLDSVILANCLYDLEDSSIESLEAAFQSYYEQRYDQAKAHYRLSEMMSKILSGQTWTDRLFRKVLMNLPQWVQQAEYAKSAGYRPQIMFLPQIENRGTIPALPQKPCKRYGKVCKDGEAKREETTPGSGSVGVQTV